MGRLPGPHVSRGTQETRRSRGKGSESESGRAGEELEAPYRAAPGETDDGPGARVRRRGVCLF